MKSKNKLSMNFKSLREKGINDFFKVTSILKDNHVNFWLDFGTLLGAVRNGCPVPWDGEFDISVWDDEININSKMWNDIRNLGFSVVISEYNIKVTNEKQIIGSFVIDIHRYKRQKKHGIYLYGNIPYKLIDIFIYKTKLLIELFMPVKLDKTVNFGELYSLALEKHNGNLNESENFAFNWGKINKYPFTLKFEHFAIGPTIDAGKSFIIQILERVIQYFPNSLLNIIYKKLLKLQSRIKFKTLSNYKVEEFFFLSFQEILFCGEKIQAPMDYEKYLENIYGKDWRIPRQKWESSKDSKAFTN